MHLFSNDFSNKTKAYAISSGKYLKISFDKNSIEIEIKIKLTKVQHSITQAMQNMILLHCTLELVRIWLGADCSGYVLLLLRQEFWKIDKNTKYPRIHEYIRISQLEIFKPFHLWF